TKVDRARPRKNRRRGPDANFIRCLQLVARPCGRLHCHPIMVRQSIPVNYAYRIKTFHSVMTTPVEFSSRSLDRLRIRHLRLLELIADTGSLTSTAAALKISQPAATKMLQELERALGCTLVNRTPKGGMLTAA